MKTWHAHFPHWPEGPRLHPSLAGVLEEGPHDAAELAFAQQVDAADKVEVHVHAEAAVPAAFYEQLDAGGAPPLAPGPFLDFHDFLHRWMANLARLRRSSDYAALGRALVADRAARRIVRCDCHVSPLDTSVYRSRAQPSVPALDLAQSLAHFVTGLREGMAAHAGVRVRAVVDLVHVATTADLDAAYAALAPLCRADDNRDHRGEPILVGIGLGGPERPERAPFFAAALLRFRALGLKLDLHSGEQLHVSAAQHRAALQTLQPERVGHGIRGAAQGFFFTGALASCPLSNLLLGCHAGPLRSHPIAQMAERGLNVSVNTDDPLLLGTNLVLEYVALRRALGLELDFFHATQQNARRQVF